MYVHQSVLSKKGLDQAEQISAFCVLTPSCSHSTVNNLAPERKNRPCYGGQKGNFGSRTLNMTFEGLGEMFKGNTADVSAGNFSAHFCRWGVSRMHRPRSKDPHRCRRKLDELYILFVSIAKQPHILVQLPLIQLIKINYYSA